MGLNITALLVLGLSLATLKLTIAASEHNWAPKYHVAPEKGWMNDPNGLIYWGGFYHAFYQHYPNDTKWGTMHWGHARSSDMLEWEHLPIALTPSLPEDIDGIFSGTAIQTKENLTLIYTGVSGNYAHQMQCMATSSDGLTFTKKGAILRRNGDDKDFRDPKAWFQDGSWFMLVGTKIAVDEKASRGEVLLYKSLDLNTWDFEGVFAQANDEQGDMWECPDLFSIGDKQILVVSPQGIKRDDHEYQNLFQTGYFIGTWSPGGEYKIEKQFRLIDHGHDFYASGTFEAPDGRRILMAWLDMWDSVFPESAEGWAGMLTLPRELTLSPSGDLEVRPIKEVKERRNETTAIKKSNLVLNSSIIVRQDISSSEIVVVFNLTTENPISFGVRIGDEAYSNEGVRIIINGTENRLFLERNYPQYNVSLSSRSIPLHTTTEGQLTLDIFVDRSSIELFVNDGQAVLSSRIYPKEGERDLSFFMNGGGTMIINRYEIYNL